MESPGWREVQEVSVQDKKRHIPGGRPESRGSEEGKITQKRKNTSQVVGQSLEGRRERGRENNPEKKKHIPGGIRESRGRRKRGRKNNPEKKRHIPCGRPESRGQGDRGEYPR